MRLIKDGQEAEVEGIHTDVESLLLPYLNRPEAEPRVVVRLSLDGQEVPAGDLDDLSRVSLDECERVDVETASVCEVARQSLASAGEYADRVREALFKTAQLMRTDRPEVANDSFIDTIDAMSILLFTLQAASQHLGPEANSVEEITAKVQPWLDALADAQQAQDWIRVADYLEYEIAPVLGETRGRVAPLCSNEALG
ncbi:MAG: hypothetical protein GY723_04710 [bacterium]|nr:hypothetical protein [bacterium]MCP5067745.1 hypothetical protein [bacterium]